MSQNSDDDTVLNCVAHVEAELNCKILHVPRSVEKKRTYSARGEEDTFHPNEHNREKILLSAMHPRKKSDKKSRSAHLLHNVN